MTDPGAGWPVLRSYDRDHQLRVAMPLGGIGTGTVSLGGRGDLRDWELGDTPRKGWVPQHSVLAIRTAPADGADGDVDVRALEGPVDPTLYEGWQGCAVPNHTLPRFADATFHAAYPLAQVALHDGALPVDVTLQAFNPLVPTEPETSGQPFALLRAVVRNTGPSALEVTVAGSVENIAVEGADPDPRRNVLRDERRATGVLLRADAPADGPRSGSLALAAIDEPHVTRRTGWTGAAAGGALLDFWDDLTEDGRLDDRTGDDATLIASVAATRRLEPGAAHAFAFVLAWHFPDRRSWDRDAIVGNLYTGWDVDAWGALVRNADQLEDLEARTVAFVRAVTDADLPAVVAEAALCNLSTLRTQTAFRTPDGRLLGWEGCMDGEGSCYGTCTHVWNYEQVTPYLFGSLAHTLRDVELAHATGEDGHMSFRVQLPLDRARTQGVAAADGQMGAVVKLYRDWRLSGDQALLRTLWPAARRALAFAWVPGGWDADRDGVMEGSQHNTMDVEYFGPNPEVGTWYLAALRAAEEMARAVGDEEFAATCADLFARGSAWLDAELFDGEYYPHEIRPPMAEERIAPGLRLPGVGARDLVDPELQVGDACLAGQLVGQNAAHLAGLGYLLDPEHVATTLRSILRHNAHPAGRGHFNPRRSYVMADEPGLLVAAYPHGNRPCRPFPYFAEVWTGLEYVAAVGMAFEGLREEALGVVRDVRSRFDGRRRNPFSEVECGHHYVRAMGAWGLVPALTGFGWDAVTGVLRFAAADRTTRWFWSTGWAWGTMCQEPADDCTSVVLEVLGGDLPVTQLALAGVGAVAVDAALAAGDRLEVVVPAVVDAGKEAP